MKDPYLRLREEMVRGQVAARGVEDVRVLEAMRELPREWFVPKGLERACYEDGPLGIGGKQTISQPYIVGYMLEALELTGREKVLEVGTGSGYNAALLAMLAGEVYSVERIPELASGAKAALARCRRKNLHLSVGDGYGGIPAQAPFDRIVLTAAPPMVPEALFTQLADGGILLAPEGEDRQSLIRWRRRGAQLERENLLPVQFVPMLRGVSPRDPPK
ncbi:MAG: protein-L-isoaspartate(D-aspartate) O-methyltransferase [Bdellovibrionales bacterium]|nr:protein-L-isoaspartate(D-aspartate) O-methyltransferase [Bdellovibrionales bacterium]